MWLLINNCVNILYSSEIYKAEYIFGNWIFYRALCTIINTLRMNAQEIYNTFSSLCKCNLANKPGIEIYIDLGGIYIK